MFCICIRVWCLYVYSHMLGAQMCVQVQGSSWIFLPIHGGRSSSFWLSSLLQEFYLCLPSSEVTPKPVCPLTFLCGFWEADAQGIIPVHPLNPDFMGEKKNNIKAALPLLPPLSPSCLLHAEDGAFCMLSHRPTPVVPLTF